MKAKFKSCLCSNCINDLITNQPKIVKVILFFVMLNFNLNAQFHAAPGSTNTSAMHKDSSAFVSWAKTCAVTRGWQDASNHSLGTTTVGVDVNGTLKANDNPVVSLGDGGYAILTFSNAIKNGPGYDFAVFENAFDDSFLELAFVEVSSDGINYTRFRATSNTQYTAQIGAFDPLDCSKVNNLAGKYRANYGTPFDLEELKDEPGLNVNAITHIKIIDVVGSITPSLATYDMNNNIINDPFPTAFGSGGFDLDAVGVINETPAGLDEQTMLNTISIYPNPFNDILNIRADSNKELHYKVFNITGNLLKEDRVYNQINLNELTEGPYFLHLECGDGWLVKKIYKK